MKKDVRSPLQAAGGSGFPATKTIALEGTNGQTMLLEVSPNAAGEMGIILTERSIPQTPEAARDPSLMPLKANSAPSGVPDLNPDTQDAGSGPMAIVDMPIEEGEKFIEDTMHRAGLETPPLSPEDLPDDLSDNLSDENDMIHEEDGDEIGEEESEDDPDALAALAEFDAAGLDDPEIKSILAAPDPFKEADETAPEETPPQSAMMDGDIEDYHADGWLMSRMAFHLGLLHGPSIFFTKDGRIQERMHFVRGKLEGPFERFDDDGTPTVRLNYVAGKLEGRSEFYQNGTLNTVVQYKENKIHGTAISYGHDGEKSAEIEFEAGYQTGPLLSYNEEGNLNSRMNFYRGVLQGEWQSYYENGDPLQEGSYNEGRKEGSFITYHESGITSQIAHYANGKLTDPPIIFDKKGKETRKL